MTVLFVLPYILGSFPISLSPTGIASGGAFGTASVSRGPVAVAPTGIASASAVGSATVTRGAVGVSPTGVSSGEAFGDAMVERPNGAQHVSPTGFTSGAIGSPTVTPGVAGVALVGVSSAEAFGDTGIVPGPVTVTAAGVGSGGALGAPIVIRGFKLSPTGIPGILGSLAFGTPTVGFDSGSHLHPSSVVSSEVFGRPTVGGGVVLAAIKRTYVVPAEDRTTRVTGSRRTVV